jgi:hypothetical protein
MKTAFGAAVAIALFLSQSLWAEDTECGGKILRGGCIDMASWLDPALPTARGRDHDLIFVLSSVHRSAPVLDSGQLTRELGQVSTDLGRSMLNGAKMFLERAQEDSSEAARDRRQIAVKALQFVVNSCPNTPEAKEAAELLKNLNKTKP